MKTERFEKKVWLSSPTMHGNEIKYINEAIERNWVAPLGFNCDSFEKEMSEHLCKNCNENVYALSLSSGTAAIHLAVKLAGITPGDIVLCSDMTFAATVNPIVYEGGIPVFIDSEKETWNMDPKALEEAFKKYPNAKAVMLVHLYGVPAKINEIKAICKKHNAILIEDAAEALCAEYNGRQCGTFGEYTALSFNGNKLITTSGGGMLITKEISAREKAFFWATQSREKTPWYEHKEIGYNYRMSNIVAGIGLAQLEFADEHRDRKEKIYRNYEKGFENLPLSMNPYMECTKPNFWLSCMLIDDGCHKEPIEIMKKLEEYNVEARPIWKPMHMQPVFEKNDFIFVEEKPVDEKIFEKGLCLPSDIKMSEEEQNAVIEIIKSCF